MRKNSILSLLFIVFVTMFPSCKKEITESENQVGSSKVTYYANLELNGNQYESVVLGDTYKDEGAKAEAQGAPLDVTSTGSVNTNKAGLYNITYKAVNADGFPATITRTVAVLPSAEEAGIDISGSYFYVSTGSNNASIKKLAPGFYSTTNCWSSATTIPCLFICVDGETISIPNQATAYGELFGSGTLSATGALKYTINIPSQGIVGSVRSWQKAQ